MNRSHRWTLVALAAGALATIAATMPPAATQEPDGAALYRQHCRSCHGADGVPTARMATLYPKLRALDSTFLATLSADSIVAGLKQGLPGMKPFGGKLSDAEMRAVAQFTKSLGRSPRTP